MKTIIFLFAILFITGRANAQYILMNEVPQSIRDSFVKRFPTWSDAKWSIGSQKNFSVEFLYGRTGDTTKIVQYNQAGALLVIKTLMSNDNIPNFLLANLKKEYPEFSLKNWYHVEYPNGKKMLEVHIRDHKNVKYIFYELNGTMLTKEEITSGNH